MQLLFLAKIFDRQLRLKHRAWQYGSSWLLGSLIAVVWSLGTPGIALNRLTIRIGPIAQTIEVADLEQFARTGEVPPRLRLYSTFLTPQVRQVLQNQLSLDPDISDRIVDDILQSANGELLLDTLSTIAPDLSVDQLRAAIRLAAMSTDGLSVLGILRALPQDSLEIDASAAIALISQLNLSRLESQALSSVLDYELTDSATDALPANFDPAAPGPESVEQWELQLRDRDRDRIVPIDIYWSDDSQGPVVVLSHGFGADRRFLAYAAQHLASHGLTVVAIEHPGSNVAALSATELDPRAGREPSRILPATEFIDRPQDVSFVLDELAKLNRHSFALRGKLKTDQVTLIGHSLGGYTGLALAGANLDTRELGSSCSTLIPVGLSPADWLQCAATDLPRRSLDLSDARIQQVVAMNPLIGDLFGSRGLTQVTVPTLMLTSTNDGVTPTIKQQIRPFSQLAGPKYLVAVIGGTHLSVGDPQNINPALQQIPFMPELQGEETQHVRQFVQGLLLSFVKQQTPEADLYAPFLSAAYAQSMSTAELPVRFSTELPQSLTNWLRLTGSWSSKSRSPTGLLASLMHLEVIQVNNRLGRLPHHVFAYLRLSYPPLIVLDWPWQPLRQS
ncbi:MAG: alpha/beta fold hydrolase [Leptolyngbya sp. SIO4C5]|nr:alpha/beta fold hydrolase [Leptolyngbya sp. SIO4C5]